MHRWIQVVNGGCGGCCLVRGGIGKSIFVESYMTGYEYATGIEIEAAIATML